MPNIPYNIPGVVPRSLNEVCRRGATNFGFESLRFSQNLILTHSICIDLYRESCYGWFIKNYDIRTKLKIPKVVHPKPIAPRREKFSKSHGSARTHPPRPVQPSRSGPARYKRGLPSRSHQFQIRVLVIFQKYSYLRRFIKGFQL